jgi:pimeloyl-ACP methyl ester carboxylesterase
MAKFIAENNITLYPNQSIAIKTWGDTNGTPIIGLHGWLDNANTFDLIAPLLPDSVYFIAIDLPGHGLSSHKPIGTYFHMSDIVIDIFMLADKLQLSHFGLLGHSLGACLASLIAGTFPERITALALIDGLGPLTTPPEQGPAQLRTAIEDHRKLSKKSLPLYASVHEATQARLRSAFKISYPAAEILVKRGIKPVNHHFTWRTDPRLLLTTPEHMTEEHVLSFLSEITAPTCLIRPLAGYPFPVEKMRKRMQQVKKLVNIEIPGDHHVHLETPEIIAAHLAYFFININ